MTAVPDMDAAAQEGDQISGRWEFQHEAPAVAAPGGRGRGGRTGGQAGPVSTRVFLELKAGPANSLTGSISGLSAGGRRGVSGGGPLQAVEISDGVLDGSQVSFKAWTFDGYKNTTSFEGALEGGTLKLTMSREAPDGGTTVTEVTARRLSY